MLNCDEHWGTGIKLLLKGHDITLYIQKLENLISDCEEMKEVKEYKETIGELSRGLQRIKNLEIE